MKKILIMLLALSIAAFAFAGCGDKNIDPPAKHTANDYWSASPESHWHDCSECDDKTELGKHTFDENGECTVCRATVYENEDGSKDVYVYDEQGALTLQAGYDSNGEQTYIIRSVNEYYDDGNVSAYRTYIDGILTDEATFLRCKDPENGEVYMSEYIAYEEDGSKRVEKYDEASNLDTVTFYDAEGEITAVERNTYEFDGEGNRLRYTTYVNDKISRDIFSFVAENGEVLDSKCMYYDDNGETESEYIYEYEFDDAGNQKHQALKINGILNFECYYSLDSEGFAYTSREITYDENGKVVEDISYDAEGNEID